MGDSEMEKLELLMGEFLERVERCFTSERRLSFVIVKDPAELVDRIGGGR